MKKKIDKWNEPWKIIKKEIKNSSTPPSYNYFIKPLELYFVDEQIKIFYIEVPDNIYLEMVKRYKIKFEETIKNVTNESYKVIFQHTEELVDKKEKEKEKPVYNPALRDQKIFIPLYTFDNFVQGSCNKFAYAAAYAVAENPSEAYNPLYIYGGSGLGKTHLMNAIGIHLLENKPSLNVLYITAETFTNECTYAIKTTTMNEFKRKYRKLDVLLIDDIQFLENKESTQEEFFHTFNELYKLEKQIIISSDRPPSKLTKLDERLRSRFAWKLMADIQPADYETRIAILMKKAESKNIEITDDIYDVICLIAENIKNNIRELEGAFNRVVTFSLLMERDINKKFARDILKEIMKNNYINPTPERIKLHVSKHYNITVEDLEGSKRNSNISYPRQIAMFICREITDYSLPKIGDVFGGRHYTTVMHGCEKIQQDIAKDENFKEKIYNLIDNIKGESY